MFYVDKTPILTDDIDVLNELKLQLHIRGIERFAQFKIGASNIQFNCPIHSNGQERKPSCGISTVGEMAGIVHCFTCGYTATLSEMVSDCFGYDDLGQFGKEWLLQNFITVSVEQRKDIHLDLDRKKEKKVTYIDEQELDSYRYIHPYMYKRGLTDELIEKFDIGYDRNFRLKEGGNKIPSITFPVRDETGGTLFIGRRAINQKLFSYPQNVDKPVYGLYELPKDTKEIVVCESMFNALTCYRYGVPAVALLGVGNDLQYRQLEQLNVRKLILGLDPDSAGDRARKRIKDKVKNKIITELEIPVGKDINDLTEKEFKNLEEFF